MPDVITLDRPARPEFGTGARWLDLIATRERWSTASPVERLTDSAALTSWLNEHGLHPDAEPTAADLGKARQVRGALRELAVARVHGSSPHPHAFDAVNAALAHAVKTPRQIVVPDPIEPGQLRRRLPDVDAALALIVEEAVDTLVGPDAGHLRACDEIGCGALFLDGSGRRRWCTTQLCGTRARVRAHRARRKALAN
jgi:predicted RNA-binding Zn ribbon-like protein